ncbi:MAG: 50S ribosomal protein L28 [Coriobacteriales bacterium]|nr:50S ribosomal protein L28 [Coriobacteriales bacterium]
MSNVCSICGKGPKAGRNVSHSHRVTNRVFTPNIQKVTIKDKNGHVHQARVCAKCLKAGKVVRA